MTDNLTLAQVLQEVAEADVQLFELDGRASRLWSGLRIAPVLWHQSQYPNPVTRAFWVIAIIGNSCMYFNYVEGGWGWGQFATWGKIDQYHWQQDEIHHVVFQTLMFTDNGGVSMFMRSAPLPMDSSR